MGAEGRAGCRWGGIQMGSAHRPRGAAERTNNPLRQSAGSERKQMPSNPAAQRAAGGAATSAHTPATEGGPRERSQGHTRPVTRRMGSGG